MKHRRYIGNAYTAYAGVLLLVFTVFSVFAAVVVLYSKVNFATVFLSIMCASCSILHTIIMVKYGANIFSYCVFCGEYVIIKPLFRSKYKIEYNRCVDIGVGYYNHGILNSNMGPRVLMIYLSYNKIDEKYKDHINLLKTTESCIKIGYRKKTFIFLTNTLPKRQATMLSKSLKGT